MQRVWLSGAAVSAATGIAGESGLHIWVDRFTLRRLYAGLLVGEDLSAGVIRLGGGGWVDGRAEAEDA